MKQAHGPFIVFTDVDGVYNRYFDKTPRRTHDLDGELIRNLYAVFKQLPEDVAIKIVSISPFDLEEMQRQFGYQRMVVDEQLGGRFKNRPQTIDNYLDTHKYREYVILDDEEPGYMDHPRHRKHFVYVDGLRGFRDEDIALAAAVLRGESYAPVHVAAANYRRLCKKQGEYIDRLLAQIEELKNPTKTFHVWSEGYSVTGQESGAQHHGQWEGTTFVEACQNWAASLSPESQKHFRVEDGVPIFWGCRMFEKEASARASFG